MNTIVSIIIPCYNQGEYISETLDSVLKQTYNDWEAIIINDGSTDNSEAIAKQYTEKDSRITLINIPNGGVSKARNLGMKIAKGTYILPLDSDDRIAPTYIEKAVDIFTKQKDVKLVYCQWSFFGSDCDTIPLKYLGYRHLLLYNSIFCSALFRKYDALAIGGYDETMTGYEDWEFFIRLLDENSKVIQIAEPLFHYRIKVASRNTEAIRQNNFIEQYIYRKNIDTYLKLFGNPINVLRSFENYENRNYRKRFHNAIEKLQMAKTKEEAFAITKSFTSDCHKKKYVARMYMNYLKYNIFGTFRRKGNEI